MLPNCGVVAVANTVGETADNMMSTFRKVCKRDGRWLGRTSDNMRRKVLRHLGVKFVEKQSSGSLKKFVEWETAKDKSILWRWAVTLCLFAMASSTTNTKSSLLPNTSFATSV